MRVLRAVLVAAAMLPACSGSDDGPSAPREGSGPYLVPADVPDGWTLEQAGRPGSVDVRVGGDPGGDLAVFVPPDGGAAVARRIEHHPWDGGEPPRPVEVAATDGRRVVESPYEPHRYVVDRYGQLVETWAEGASGADALELAAVVEPDLTVPEAHRLRRVAVLPGRWRSAGAAVDLVLRHGDRRRWVTTVPVTGAEAEAVRLLLVDDPAVSLRTEASVYELDRYPQADAAGDDAWEGMLDARTAALVLLGDPGAVLLAEARDADDARDALDLLRGLAPLLRRHTQAELEALSERLGDRRWEAARRRMVEGRRLVWQEAEDDGGRTRLLVVDRSPRYAGPDTEETRSRAAPCLVVLLRRPTVSAHDGCLWEEPVLAVGEVRTDLSGATPLREVFGLVDADVHRVELRAGDDVVAVARIVDLSREVDGRRRLFLLPWGGEPWVLRRDLVLVALDAAGGELRRVPQDFLGTFEARPADDRWR